MRLLWDENIFGVIGAFCVAAFALAVTWSVLEGALQLNGAFAGVVAIATAVVTLEGISRHHYEGRRSHPTLHRVPAERGEADATRRADQPAERRRAA